MTEPGTMQKARLKIWRGTSREQGEFQHFDIEFEEGASVLDALVAIRKDQDPNLAFRYSCFNANVCKECTMLIDGQVKYACIVKLTPETTQIEPVPNRPLLRDLVTDTLSRREKT